MYSVFINNGTACSFIAYTVPRHHHPFSNIHFFSQVALKDALKDCDCLCLLTVSLGISSTYVENVSITICIKQISYYIPSSLLGGGEPHCLVPCTPLALLKW